MHELEQEIFGDNDGDLILLGGSENSGKIGFSQEFISSK